MYKYELINGHYLVTIGDKRFLIDTGNDESFSLDDKLNKIIINGNEYRLKPNRLDPIKIAKSYALVTTTFDGFIGMDIIKETSLTIYKNGELDFAPHEIEDSVHVPLVKSYRFIYFIDNNIKYVIDTGASYAYGVKSLFETLTPISEVFDYNPGLGELNSTVYKASININHKVREFDLCDNSLVQGTYLLLTQADIICNITHLFDEVCVIDMNKMELILK